MSTQKDFTTNPHIVARAFLASTIDCIATLYKRGLLGNIIMKVPIPNRTRTRNTLLRNGLCM